MDCKVLWCEQSGESSDYINKRKSYIQSLGFEKIFYVSWNGRASNVDYSNSELGWLAGRQIVKDVDLTGVDYLVFSDDDVKVEGDVLGLVKKMRDKNLLIATGASTSWHFSIINKFSPWFKRNIRVLLTDLNFFIVDREFYVSNSSMFKDGDFYSQWNLMFEAYYRGIPISVDRDIKIENLRHNSGEDYSSTVKRKFVIERLRDEYPISRILLGKDRPFVKRIQLTNLFLALLR